ncbi:hypothetical protein AGOR_G00220480 [Albula goreensis]|uniref:Fibronectin type-III domain-containing protein n=1 Tax=Albula goreensis TaxID=1534307 RepID=A0A8T3CS05_9TELE|nr:hypothetical protein AGOR_G00220480 [Albula goreensis]
MSAQIWIVFLLTLGCTGLCQLPLPVNLNISSHNLVHLLTWDPPSGDPAGLQYRVQVYSLSDGTCMPLPRCERVVTPLLCNLTEALSNLQESYFLYVWAFMGNQSSKPAITEEFIPMDHSYLDPLCIRVRLWGGGALRGSQPTL